jgi:hypothetical protein
MFDRIGNGWELLKQSWSVLRQDKELVIFPILSGVACLAVMATFALPVIIQPDLFGQMFDDNKDPRQMPVQQQILMYGLLFLYYFVNYFVVVFFNTALVSCAIIRFRGENPTVGDGLRMAGRRLPQILAWAALAATVGVLLKALEDRLSFLGKFVVGLLGMAWSLVTYFVVPILAVERLGPFAAVKRSASLLKRTWGEALVGGFSLGLIYLLLCLPAFVLIAVGIFAGNAAQSVVLGAVIVGLAILWIIAVAIITSTLQQVFLAGVYMYAAEGVVPNGFSEDSLRSAFRRKRHKDRE